MKEVREALTLLGNAIVLSLQRLCLRLARGILNWVGVTDTDVDWDIALESLLGETE